MIQTLDQRTAGQIELLSSFAELPDGWDSYAAPSPAMEAIENAKSFLLIGTEDRCVPSQLEPSAMGGVGLTYSKEQREVAIEFYNNGTAHALFTDEAADTMNTTAVPTHEAGYRETLERIQSFLGA